MRISIHTASKIEIDYLSVMFGEIMPITIGGLEREARIVESCITHDPFGLPMADFNLRVSICPPK